MKFSKKLIYMLFFCAGSAHAREGTALGPGQHAFPTQNEKVPGKSMIDKSKLRDPYDGADIQSIPAKVQLTDEQRSYLVDLVAAVMRIIEGTTPLEAEEERLLGKGQFFWPKNPTIPPKTSKSYFGSSFRMHGISLRFERKSETSDWVKAGLAIHARNFPRGAYIMHIPKKVFDEFSLVKAMHEPRPDESIENPIVFYFSHKRLPGVTLKVESRGDLVSVGDPYPSSFHALEITRDPAH
jgi:hypothetical protein